MLSKRQHLLNKLAEEAVEIAQRAQKTMQFGYYEQHPKEHRNNLKWLHDEIDDLQGIIKMLNEDEDFNYKPNQEAINNKRHKVTKYAKISQDLGFVKWE